MVTAYTLRGAFLFNKCIVLDKKHTFLSSLMNLLGVFGEGTVKRLNITIYGNWGLFSLQIGSKSAFSSQKGSLL
jgi:hypothetical protein